VPKADISSAVSTDENTTLKMKTKCVDGKSVAASPDSWRAAENENLCACWRRFPKYSIEMRPSMAQPKGTGREAQADRICRPSDDALLSNKDEFLRSTMKIEFL
jgi:hypothetical protein